MREAQLLSRAQDRTISFLFSRYDTIYRKAAGAFALRYTRKMYTQTYPLRHPSTFKRKEIQH